MSIEIQNQVNEILRLNAIIFNPVYIAQVNIENFNNCDYFVCTFTHKGLSITFDYYQGLGHRVNGKPKQPKATDVLHSLLMDCIEGESFESWCNNFGYDSDSMKAYKIYNLCIDNETKLKSIFKPEIISILREAIQDY